MFTKQDRRFLKSLKIAADPEPAPAPDELDGTCQILLELGLPVDADNWMRLQFCGNPPAVGEVDGEILVDLPRWVRKVYDPDFEEEEEE